MKIWNEKGNIKITVQEAIEQLIEKEERKQDVA
jgi:hypothetical protein